MLSELKRKFEEASAIYAARHAIRRDPDWYILKLQEEVGELTQAWNNATGRGRIGRSRRTPCSSRLQTKRQIFSVMSCSSPTTTISISLRR